MRPLIRIAHRLTGGLTMPERVILDHELVLLVRGRCTLALRDRDIALGPHHLLCLPPWLPHRFQAEVVCEHVAVHFDLAPDMPPSRGEVADRPPYEVRLAPELELPLHQVLTPADGIEEALIALLRDREGNAAGQLAASARLALIIAKLARPRAAPAAAASDPVDARIAEAVRLMRASLAEPLTMGDCARAAGMSPTRFAHRFRERLGYAPMEYLRRLRIEQARVLLGDPGLTVKAVAARCGFPDQYHFSRVFRQVDGLAPSRFREAVLAGRTPA